MAATYDDSLPGDKDRVRAMLGGGVTILPVASPLLTDEHITAVLAAQSTVAATVAWLAKELIVRFAGKPTTIKAGDVAVSYADRIPEWRRLANEQSGVTGATSSLGTLSVPISSVW